MRPLTFAIPLRTNTGLNAREHWRVRAQRVRNEHLITASFCPYGVRAVRLPVNVHLVRISPATRLPDDDGVVGGLKGVRDAIAYALGVDDGARDKIRFTYAAERGPWAVRVSITTLAEAPA